MEISSKVLCRKHNQKGTGDARKMISLLDGVRCPACQRDRNFRAGYLTPATKSLQEKHTKTLIHFLC